MSKAGHTAAIFSHTEASQTNAPRPNDNNTPTRNTANTPDEKLSSNQPPAGKLPARRDQASESTTPSTPEDSRSTRQVIAVSASKGPAAFFNLSRKFLVTDEEIDLSALEGAIVSAVDAAHLLERSKLATIVRYVIVAATCTHKRAAVAPLTRPFIVAESKHRMWQLSPNGGRPLASPSLHHRPIKQLLSRQLLRAFHRNHQIFGQRSDSLSASFVGLGSSSQRDGRPATSNGSKTTHSRQ